MGKSLRPGDVIHLNWSPQSGSEMAQKHYGVVLSVETFNKLIPRIVVAPITSKDHPQFGPLRIPIQSVQGKLHGFICLDHLRCLDADSRGVVSTDDELTFACKSRCKEVLKKIFGI